MAYVFSLNLEPLTFGEALWNMKEALVAGGWTVEASGDGTGGNYGHAGALPKDRHAPGGPYVDTLDLQNSWMRLRAPGAMSPVREFVFHHNSATIGRVLLMYSSNGTGFTGGAPSATVIPTAADEVIIVSDTAQLFDLTDGLVRQDILVGDASENFCFLMGTRMKDGVEISNGYNCAVYLDAVDNASASDPDPAIVGAVSDGEGAGARLAMNNVKVLNEAYTSTFTNIGNSRGWYDKGGADLWRSYPILMMGGELGGGHRARVEDGAGTDPNGNVEELTCWYLRGTGATEPGRKGSSHLFKSGAEFLGFLRPEGGGAPFARMNLGFLTMPWDGATRPVW